MKETENENIIEAVGFYKGYSAKSNYDVDLKIGFEDQNVTNALRFIAGIGNRLRVLAFVDEKKEKIDLGYWSVYKFVVDHNAQGLLTLKSNKDDSFTEDILGLMSAETIRLKAKIIYI